MQPSLLIPPQPQSDEPVKKRPGDPKGRHYTSPLEPGPAASAPRELDVAQLKKLLEQ